MVRYLHASILASLVVLSAAPAWADRGPASRPAAAPRAGGKAYVLHLPGIGGFMGIDRAMLAGLEHGRDVEFDVYDWTCDDPGFNALVSYDRNRKQAQIIADRLTAAFRADPVRPIVLTGHSGGTGLAVWALEMLPDDVHVQTLALLHAAVSPTYDLSKALAHVRGTCYALTSLNDSIVLGAGTKLLGTIDGVKTESAGRIGFTQPPSAEVEQYKKLVQMPYRVEWLKLHNIGDHIGPMSRPFAREVLAPLLLDGIAPRMADKLAGAATTRPAAKQ
ncbi:MAG: hypothetical protein ACREIT_05915 [Tepidisphaeraceae bacterium]